MTKNSDKKDFVFIASGGRTGTTFFGERLNEVVEGCYSQHEPDVLARDWEKATARTKDFGLWHMVFGRLLGITGLRVMGHRYMAGKLDDETAIRRLREQRKRWHDSIDDPLVIESSWRYWMLAPLLPKAFPGSRLVGIIRDPRDWVESWRRHQPRRHTKYFEGWFPQGPMKPKDINDGVWVDRWKDMDPFGRLAWDWRIITRELDRAAASGADVKIFRFEDLFGPDESYVKAFVDYAAMDGKYPVGDLSTFRSSVRNASKGPHRHWMDWPDEHVLLIDDLCGEAMRPHGYGNEPEWVERVAKARANAAA